MNWVFDARTKQKLSQEDLVRRLETGGFSFTRSTVSTWETGKNNPPLHDPLFRRALADAFQVSIHELLILAGYEVGDFKHKKESERAADLLDQLPEAVTSLFLGLLEAFRNQTISLDQALSLDDSQREENNDSIVVLDTLQNAKTTIRTRYLTQFAANKIKWPDDENNES